MSSLLFSYIVKVARPSRKSAILCLLYKTPTTPPTCPPELEREIFEMAAAEHPEMMPTLVLVAHRVL
jgi:hypothetical protein